MKIEKILTHTTGKNRFGKSRATGCWRSRLTSSSPIISPQRPRPIPRTGSSARGEPGFPAGGRTRPGHGQGNCARPVAGVSLQRCDGAAIDVHSAPVAQLDRALPSEGRGRGFESRRVRHSFPQYIQMVTRLG